MYERLERAAGLQPLAASFSLPTLTPCCSITAASTLPRLHSAQSSSPSLSSSRLPHFAPISLHRCLPILPLLLLSCGIAPSSAIRYLSIQSNSSYSKHSRDLLKSVRTRPCASCERACARSNSRRWPACCRLFESPMRVVSGDQFATTENNKGSKESRKEEGKTKNEQEREREGMQLKGREGQETNMRRGGEGEGRGDRRRI